MRLDRLRICQHRIDEHADLIQIELGRKTMLGQPARRLVFERQRYEGTRVAKEAAAVLAAVQTPMHAAAE